MFFRGRSLRTLDPKGRLMLPPDFRDKITAASSGSGVVLTTYDGCIVGFPMSEWEEFEIRMSRLVNPSRRVRDFRRLVLGGAEEMQPDAQGRIRLSKDQQDYAGIEREVILMGQGPRFEIWAPKRLQPVLDQVFDNVAGDLAESGIDFGF